MKYSELISFNPIEDVIQLTTADDANKAREYVRTYVMSDAMADSLQAPVIDQLQMDEVVDNKGILVVGNYGTGKSHLMSVISAIAKDADNLQYLQNKKFAKSMEPIAGKFEVLRIEIGGVTMSLREILFGFIQDDFDARGIDFDVPDFSTVKDNKKLIKDMIMAFNDKYPDKGYLIVVDEFLSYLTSRDTREIVLDLEFFRALGEMCSKSNLRIIFGVQEKVFDNPRFSYVSETLMHVKDRFTQIVITKEATSYVVSERILKKTAEQKALIRAHLEKFCSLYTGMSSKLDEFVDLFPIHPAYIDVLNKAYLIENRHILKNISLAIKDVFNTEVPAEAPGIISFDNYWPAIKANGLLRSDATINRVLNASQQLENIISASFPKAAYKPLAIKIIYALYPVEAEMKQQLANAKKYKSVIREEKDLTTLVGAESDFDVEEALRELLCYYEQWQGGQLSIIDRVGINDERVTRHLNSEIGQDRFSPILSVSIKNFPNEAGYFMIWELSLSDNESDRRYIPVFVNNNFVLRPMAGKRIMDVFLDPNSKLSVRSIPNISQDGYERLEKMCMDFSYDTFVELRDKLLQRNEESYTKYMYALKLRTEAAEQIGIDNIKQSRLRRLSQERLEIEEAYRNGKNVFPDFRLVNLTVLEA